MSDAADWILLDTHYWIWLENGDARRFLPGSLDLIEEAAESGRLLLSPISVWEVGTLERKGRVELGLRCEEWVAKALTIPGLSIAPITPDIALHSTRLPEFPHGDPADRIIVATARWMGARLATRDQRLIDYAADGHVRVC